MEETSLYCVKKSTVLNKRNTKAAFLCAFLVWESSLWHQFGIEFGIEYSIVILVKLWVRWYAPLVTVVLEYTVKPHVLL